MVKGVTMPAVTKVSKSAKAPRPKIATPPAATDPFSLGLNLADTRGVHNALLAGLSFDAFVRFEKATGLARAKLAAATGIAPRTLDRRQKDKKLRPDESDRLYRLASVYRLAVELFNGRAEDATEWMETPRPALGGEIPLDLARTEVGARQVATLVMQLEQGVYV
jgi:putative toxin-antitoxin system antitoxin component (TIGR02293 family)